MEQSTLSIVLSRSRFFGIGVPLVAYLPSALGGWNHHPLLTLLGGHSQVRTASEDQFRSLLETFDALLETLDATATRRDFTELGVKRQDELFDGFDLCTELSVKSEEEHADDPGFGFDRLVHEPEPGRIRNKVQPCLNKSAAIARELFRLHSLPR